MASRTILRSLGLSLTAVVLAACPGDTTETNETDENESSEGESETSDSEPETSNTDPDSSSTDPDTTADTSTTVDPTDASSSTDPTAGDCGNGALDDGEACDGDELDGSTCSDQGFSGGRLACADDCTFDTSSCTNVKGECGDGVLDDGEECDGTELDGEDCASEGFDGGDLACADDCTFDTSSCTSDCGNGNIDDGEVCDGRNLDGADCITEGFTSGMLACAADCSAFDTSACAVEICDNGMDDDDNDLVDCEDPGCAADPSCSNFLELVVGCDATLCTLVEDGGPNGGDLCTCTIPAAQHPASDDVADAACFVGGVTAPELLFVFDQPGVAFSVSTCNVTPGDSSIAAFSSDPTAGGAASLGCNDDSTPITPPYCSELGNNAVGPASLVPTLGASELWLQIDEYGVGNYWDGITDRVIEIELVAEGSPEVCNDSLDNDFDGSNDCEDDDCAADPICVAQVETLDGCDPTYCTFAAAAGPNGGDLCTCVIPGGSHPGGDDFGDASCFGFTSGIDMLWTYDTTGYATYTVTSCDADQADSSIAAYDGAPGVGVELACDEDAGGELSFCSEIVDNGNAGPGIPALVPVSGDLQILVDEWEAAVYWDGLTQRTLTLELLTLADEICGDDVDNDADGFTDCLDTDCEGDPACAQVELLDGCDPTFCTFAAGGGANGGDLCTCVLPGDVHPVSDDLGEASCFGGNAFGLDLVWDIDVAGYTTYVATTCAGLTSDSSLAAFDGDPGNGGVELECSEDASGDFSYCSEITDNGGGGGGLPTAIPGTGELFLTIDEWNVGSYWNGLTTRTFTIELIP